MRGLAATCLAALLLLASSTLAGAQSSRTGPEWNGKDHQPTQAEVTRRENRAGVRAPPAQVEGDKRTVDQLSRQLLHDEAVNPARSVPP